MNDNWHKDKRTIALVRVLLECRDALPAITTMAAKLRGIDLSLCDRIDDVLKPWKVDEDDPNGI